MASSAMEGNTEMKFGTRVAYAVGMMPETSNTHIART